MHRPWCHKILGTRPRMTGGRGANSSGRSMIEMLGVLAIIAVLSVGGIAGYSKAMQMWKSDIQKQQLTSLFNTMVDLIPKLNRVSQFKHSHIGVANVLEAMGEIPEGMTVNGYYLYDKNLNRYYVSYGLKSGNDYNGNRWESYECNIQVRLNSAPTLLDPNSADLCINTVMVAKNNVENMQKLGIVHHTTENSLGYIVKPFFTTDELRKATPATIDAKCKSLNYTDSVSLVLFLKTI